ncbi:HlyD family efflux transporter periplasmic adaptor subunit [Desulforhopalus singaporensis]|uniref:Membrane fusion protein, adhesin transport system n=1 Tax=Desulforhopalus singaporensis TaxID=91360 RepID=A0A1H0R7V2_9BACT|nr:HlyD family efflux transporter periplasmic adaptor subunit [Desulforhopalus singaporensis]SDP25048.1 membrane fusion protein, adhesin transport system [Desulforhopalus singaporensis]
MNENNDQFDSGRIFLKYSVVVWVIFLGALVFGVWAYKFKLDEVSTGIGRVVATSKEQLIQSLEGGVLHQLEVREGDIVEKGQLLAQLDRTKLESSVQESRSRYLASLAAVARLEAEANSRAIKFPEEIKDEKDLIKSETALYQSRRRNLDDALKGLREAKRLIEKELAMMSPLVEKGAASNVEILRLKRQLNDLNIQYNDTRTRYFVQVREELAKGNAEIESLRAVIIGRSDSLNRTHLYSPVRGVVKNISITTVGGVISPNGTLMEIIPLDEKLQIETKIMPKDIAYIHPGQSATVKVTAYDYSIYGGLDGEVVLISPDTIRDEISKDYYYRVHIRTSTDSLKSKDGQIKSILPGMICSVDVHTGSKTVLQYLIKPFNKAREALRER